jgi:hypothetical protein
MSSMFRTPPERLLFTVARRKQDLRRTQGMVYYARETELPVLIVM